MAGNDKIVNGNILIAEFMGIKVIDVWHCNKGKFLKAWNITEELPYTGIPPMWVVFGSENQLKYHTSWDWLKPVIDKIFTYAIAYPEQVLPVREMKIVVEIQPAWERVVYFINWYNLQTK